MDKKEHKKLAWEIFNISYLKGDFLLRSGKRSEEYFDKYQIEARPEILEKITTPLSKLIPQDTDVLAGLELGGIPLVTALSLKLKKPACFVRKEAKIYGTCKLAEGSEIQNKKICVIEDVITTGGQVIESVRALREKKAEISHVVCLILRDKKALEILEQENLKLLYLFEKEDFENLV